MTLLAKHILVNPWTAQIIQHALSLDFHVPVRLLDGKRIFLNMPQYDNWNPDESLRDGSFFESIPDQIVKYFNDRNNSAWVTRQSNMHPLILHLRRNSYWKAWENYSIGMWLKNLNSDQIRTTDYYSNSMQIAAYPLHIEDFFKGFLLIGPCFLAPGDNSGETFFSKRVYPFVELVTEGLSKARREYQVDRDELLFLGTTRGWIGQHHLVSKAKSIGKVFETIFNMDCHLDKNHSIQRCTYNSLAQLGILVNKHEAMEILVEISRSVQKPIFFELVQHIVDNALVAEFCEGKWTLKSTAPSKISGKVWVDAADVPREHLDHVQFLISRIESLRRDLELSYGSLHHGYANDSLTRFWNWLNNEFGLVSATTNGDEDTDSYKNMYSRIARETTNLFVADICTIYRYNYDKRILEFKIAYFQDKYDPEKRVKLVELLRSAMAEADRRPDLKQLSITYRCISDKKPHFCRAWEPKEGVSDPEGERLLVPKPETGFPQFRSAISVPLVVNRRLFGVLEIAGLHPYQFRFANLTLAKDVGDVLGTFLYQKEIFGSLGRLNSVVLDQDIEDHEKYTKICEEFTNIFLANASALYVPDVSKRDVYHLISWHNRSDLDELRKQRIGPLQLNHSMTDSPLIEAVKLKKWYIVSNVHELIKTNLGWQTDLPQRQAIPENFDWMVAIPVKDPRRDDRILCGLYLYYRNTPEEKLLPPLSDRWKPTINFMSFCVALLVAAIQSSQEREDRIQNILRHELKQTVDLLGETTGDLLDFIDRGIPEDIPPDHIPDYVYSILIRKSKDLLSARQMLLKIADMLRAPDFRKFLSSGVDPTLYLITKDGKIDIYHAATKVNVRSLFNQIRKPLMDLHDRKKINFLIKGPIHGPVLLVNRLILQRIFQNLLDNAAKYSLPGTNIVLRVEETQMSLKFHFTNEANCLEEEEEHKIFQYSYKGTNADGEGDGVGLAVARRLCEVMEGSLKLNMKQLGTGKCFFDFIMTIPKTLRQN